MKNTVDKIEALCHKLIMLGIPIGVSTNIYFENGALCVNMTRP